MRWKAVFLGILVGAWVGTAAAGVSVGGEYTAGSHYQGWESRAGWDAQDWALDAAYARTRSTRDAGSRTQQASLGFLRDLSDRWTGRLSLTGWRDELNHVEYAGPGAAFSYTALRDADDDLSNESFKITFGADLFALTADQTTSPKLIKKNRTLVLVPAQTGNVSLAQWHPSVEIEKYLGKGNVVPRLAFGHFFYSKNPSLIEERAGRPAFAASAGSLQGLIGGMPKNEARAGLLLLLPWRLDLDICLGGQQGATDNAWSATQTGALGCTFFKRVRIEVLWSRSIQDGKSQDLTSGGLTLKF